VAAGAAKSKGALCPTGKQHAKKVGQRDFGSGGAFGGNAGSSIGQGRGSVIAAA
jgi:outer membrane lipoprotein SlyB